MKREKMKKARVQDIVKVIPNILKSFGGYIKDSFDKKGQDVVDDANGVAGILIKLFAKEHVDNYFSKKTKDKLKDFGLSTYLQASLLQAGKSINQVLLEKDTTVGNYKTIVTHIEDIISKKLETFDTNEILTIFQPKYHPVIQFTKSSVKQILLEFGYDNTIYNSFLKNFNENIENTISNTFGGEDYREHKDEVKQFIVGEREAELLSDMFSLNKIGFKEDENLKYEDTFGRWKSISNLLPSSQSTEYEAISNENLHQEKSDLVLVEDLIEHYYSSKEKIVLQEIVFIVADFGKGKSVFLKHYASKLAKEYLETSEGYFPVYFNLRNFSNYQSNTTAGIIADFLRKDYGIEITSDEFKNRKYMFLIDSLDESGDLNKHTIDDVISSIKEIQNIDSTNCRDNRIIVTSRPFDDGLDSQIKNSLPFTDDDKNQYFISVHGFKEEQFNEWITNSLKDYLNKKDIETNRFTKKIVDGVKNNENIDIYALLIKNNTLTREELKRPIFAYMIYQLIINNIDFSTIGKTGVYLSFLNLLTKEAKHIDDVDCEYNLQDEIESRNILHAISALWMYEKQQGKHGTLKKADIFRVLEGKKINDDDKKVLEENIKNEASDIKFLSHSYFGANDDLLHFQHQSFAEMLLAEYYLKIFIKYALDDGDIEEARIYLNLGEPTEQTVSFFKELLQLLKDSCLDNEKEKRKLLFPLLASLATEKHNKNIRCNSLYFEWLKPMKIESLTANSNKLVENWCIDDEKLSKIINLSKLIIESKKEYLTTKSNINKALFDAEVIEIASDKLNRIPHNIDKWFSLLVGNILKNDEKNKVLFNSFIEIPEVFFDMMKDWAYSYDTAVPEWAKKHLKGIDTSKNSRKININSLNISGVDFSYSKFKDISINKCSISDSKFNNCYFDNFIIHGNVYRSQFFKINKLIDSVISFSDDNLPIELMCKFFPKHSGYGVKRKGFISYHYDVYYSNVEDNFRHESGNEEIDEIFNMQIGFFIYGLEKKVFTIEEIIDAYEYDSNETKELFSQKVKELE
jgi:hypothetical protein